MKKSILILIVLFSINSIFGQCWQTISGGGFDGVDHNLAIKSDGTLWSWGWNWQGQLGDGTLINRLNPNQIRTDTNWKLISAGGMGSIALKNNNTLWSWGDSVSNVPIQIGSDSDWQSICCGHNCNFAIKKNGTLWTWSASSPIPIQVGLDSNWKIISSNLGLNLAIKTNGTLWGWGYNRFGGIGDGTIINKLVPVQIGTDTNWSKITSGEQCGFALKSNGTLWAWGWNSDGQLGDGTLIDRLNPIQIGTDTNWLMVQSKYHHSLALKVDHTLWMWGGGFANNAKHIPTQLGSNNDWDNVSTGGNNLTLAINSNKQLWDFSKNPNPPTQIICSFLNRNNFETRVDFSIYPNPTKSNIIIERLNESNDVNNYIKITDILGKVIITTILNKPKTIVSLEKFDKGIYFVQIINEKERILSVQKIILQ